MKSTKLFVLALVATNFAFATPSSKNLRVMRLKSLREKHEEFQQEITKLKREVNKKASFVDEEVEELKEMIFMQEEMILELTEKLHNLKSS